MTAIVPAVVASLTAHAGNGAATTGTANARPVENHGTAQARETAEAFEAVLIGQLTNIMMASAGDEGDFSGGHGEAMFRGVLAENLGIEVAKRGGLGLAPAVMQEVIKLQKGDTP